MVLQVQAEVGHAIPPAPRHAITVHLPLWSNLVRWIDGDVEVLQLIKSMYQRMMLHRDIKELTDKILEEAGQPEGQACLLFSLAGMADACKDFAVSEARGEDRLPPDTVAIRVWQSCVRIYAVFFPATKRSVIQPFWTHTGTGISSRLAEECLNVPGTLLEITVRTELPGIARTAVQGELQKRIATLLERAPVGPPRSAQVSPNDVYLFPTGMAAIYTLHTSLLGLLGGTTILFGFVFKSSHFLFENFGPGCRIFGLGTPEELAELELQLEHVQQTGRGGTIQALWTEFPANPLLSSADLLTLRRLADKYCFALIIDDTIGSFCNVDVLGVADIVVTSLTKSFSGYADTMGGSIVLNPHSSRHNELKMMIDRRYENDYWTKDAETLEQNSRDYLVRSQILNHNTEKLVEFLHDCTINASSTIRRVFYPTVNPDRQQYEAFMRPKTPDFTPGYGCLFTVELVSVEAAISFYDNLAVYKGPHLGAHLTLAMAYVKGLYSKQLDWVGKYGLKETQIRISVGLEDIGALLETFRLAVDAADATQG